MNDPDTIQNIKPVSTFDKPDVFDPLVLIKLFLRNWYIFLIVFIIAFFAAQYYINHTLPVYRTSLTLLINETEDRGIMDNTQLLQGLGLPVAMRNMDNQIQILKSGSLIEQTLKDLPFETEYYFKTIRNRLPVYPETPIKVLFDDRNKIPWNTEFSISFLSQNQFILKSESDGFPFEKTASFEDSIQVKNGSLIVSCRDNSWLEANRNKELHFIIHNPTNLIRSYSRRLNVTRVSREGTLLNISLQGANRIKDADFLNQHVKNFQAISLNRKNTEAERRIQFIDDQLVGISDSLLTTETKLQQFRSTHRVMDLSAQGQAIIGQVTLLENERARLELEANYYDYLANYLEKESSGEIPIVPVTMGISDPTLTRLVDELTQYQGQLSSRGAGELNPLQRNLDQRIRSTKESLKETLNGLRRANSLARSENQAQINRTNAQASSLPVTERQLLGIERKFRLNDELYTFLLETRANQQMQKASNRADSEVVDPADPRFSSLVSPISQRINLFSMFGAFLVTYLVIFLRFVFNKKLKEEDIRQMTNIPVVGNIPHSPVKINKIVIESPDSTIAESYRHLRSRMQFLTKDTSAPVILVTSSMPGEGKTATSINLAAAYSLLGKKTILIGFDLRKPKLFQDFDLNNDKGISTWLIGKDKLEDIIQETSVEHLSVITAGPVPPNPSELTALEKTSELFKILKGKYDFIIVDSSPIGVVSDTIYLSSLADVCILVIRPGHTLTSMLDLTLNEINANGIKNIGIVLNSIHLKSKHYGYGGRYGYTTESKPSRLLSLKTLRK